MVKYQGGKAKVARKLAAMILEREGGSIDRYFEPFVGGAAVAELMAAHCGAMALGDARADMVLMWQAASRGWEPPWAMSRETYADLRHAVPSALRGFAGSAVSFGGKWFGGYSATDPDSPGGACAAGARTATRAGARLAACSVIAWYPGVDFFDYDSPGAGAVAYLDPPYAGTLGYGASFDNERFWKVAESWACEGVRVYVSEYAAPGGWQSIWSQRKPVALSAAANDDYRLEHLFVWSDQC